MLETNVLINVHFLNQNSNLFNYFWPFLNVSDSWRHIKTMQRLVESTSSQKAVRMILASILSLYHIQLSHYLQMVSGIRWPQFYPIRDISESVYISYILFPPSTNQVLSLYAFRHQALESFQSVEGRRNNDDKGMPSLAYKLASTSSYTNPIPPWGDNRDSIWKYTGNRAEGNDNADGKLSENTVTYWFIFQRLRWGLWWVKSQNNTDKCK